MQDGPLVPDAAAVAAAALAAAAAAPPDGRGTPDLGSVAAAVAAAAAGRWCVLTAAGRDHVAGVPAGGVVVQVVQHGAVVGALRLDAPEAVCRRVAAVLGPVCANAAAAARLGALRRTAQDAATGIGDARLRAAADMDTERRKLERDLHDGAQHHLVSLGLTVALLENAVESGGDPQPWLDRLGDQLDTTEHALARTAAGVLPVLLVRAGLVAALRAELGADAVHTEGVGERRYPAVVESGVWFTCLEAVNNARKHAPGSTIAVSLLATARGLAFEVTDDGPGFTVTPSASGLHHMRTRVGAIGGTVEIRSAPGAGTTVAGFVPI